MIFELWNFIFNCIKKFSFCCIEMKNKQCIIILEKVLWQFTPFTRFKKNILKTAHPGLCLPNGAKALFEQRSY